jgi:hypothetical protein
MRLARIAAYAIRSVVTANGCLPVKSPTCVSVARRSRFAGFSSSTSGQSAWLAMTCAKSVGQPSGASIAVIAGAGPYRSPTIACNRRLSVRRSPERSIPRASLHTAASPSRHSIRHSAVLSGCDARSIPKVRTRRAFQNDARHSRKATHTPSLDGVLEASERTRDSARPWTWLL